MKGKQKLLKEFIPMEEKKFKVSVVVRAYNVQNYIEECLQSIVKQTLPDIQIVIIEDCSTDNTLEKLYTLKAEYEKQGFSIVLHNNDKNYGAGYCLVKAKEFVLGKYTCILDADDYYTGVNALQYLYDICTTENLDFIQGNYYHWECFFTTDLFIRSPIIPVRLSEDHYIKWIERHCNNYSKERLTYYVHYRENPNSLCRDPNANRGSWSEGLLRTLWDYFIIEEKPYDKVIGSQINNINISELSDYLIEYYLHLKDIIKSHELQTSRMA